MTKTSTVRIRFKVNARQAKVVNKGVRAFGVTDFEAFVRGAIVSQLGVVQRAKNPAWLSFQAAVQGRAKRILGHRFKLQTLDEVLKLGRLRP